MKKINILLVLLVILGLRSLHEVNLGQSLVAMSIVALYAFKMFMDTKKQPDLNEDVKSQLAEMKNIVSGLYVKNAAKPNQDGKRFF